MTSKVEIPHRWAPRDYQEPFWSAMLRGCKRAMLVWHRRAGKDLTAFNWAILDLAVLHPGGQVWHLWPTYEQGRKGWWDAADNTGRRFIDFIPPQLIKRKREDQMMIELTNGSIYRVVGAEDPSRLVGANPIGLIITEYALQNPEAWNYLRPILAANEGWAVFPMTPRGRNHAHQLWVDTAGDPKWFRSLLTIEDTKALGPEVLDEERRAGMAEELIRQEYYCSFNAPMSGAFYSTHVDRAEADGRIGDYPHDPALVTETWWDLGIRDATAIWFVQRFGSDIRLIDYEEESGLSLQDWIKRVYEKPYIYSRHIGPHDIDRTEYSTGLNRMDYAASLGLHFKIAPRLPVIEGIDITRRLFPRFFFNEDTTWRGIEALRTYRKQWDEKKLIYSDNPVHDWASHGADALRTGATTSESPNKKKLPRKYNTRYDPFAASRPYGG